MRVLIVSHHALPHVGGLEVLVDYEIRALVEAGHEVTLITSNGTGAAQTPAYPESVRIIRVPAWHILERRFRLPYPIFSPRLVSTAWSEVSRCDVIHVHGFMFLSSLVAVLVARLRGRSVILTDHGGIQHFDSPIKSVLARIGAETVGRITTRGAYRLVTYNTRIGRLLARFGRPNAQSVFLPNPVDGQVFFPVDAGERGRLRQQLGWTQGRAKVLFVGRMTEEKGVPQLLACASTDYDLVFCGSGDPSILGALPRDGIEYLPPRPQIELVKLYQAADVLVVPSKVREGFPLVVQEALSCGLRVVLGYDDGFEPYRALAGLQFCEPNAAELRRAIGNALAAPDSSRERETLQLFPQPRDWIERLYGSLHTAT